MMALVTNPVKPMVLVWQCQYCQETFTFVDVGQQHETECAKNPANIKPKPGELKPNA
jgi:hypothetical protein